jgi:hypothetical protein
MAASETDRPKVQQIVTSKHSGQCIYSVNQGKYKTCRNQKCKNPPVYWCDVVPLEQNLAAMFEKFGTFMGLLHHLADFLELKFPRIRFFTPDQVKLCIFEHFICLNIGAVHESVCLCIMKAVEISTYF